MRKASGWRDLGRRQSGSDAEDGERHGEEGLGKVETEEERWP